MRKTLYFLLLAFLMVQIAGITQNADNKFTIQTFPYVAPAQDNENTNFDGDNFTPPEFSRKVITASEPSRYAGNILVLEVGTSISIYHYSNSLVSLGLSHTLVTSWSAFETEFNNYSWDMLIINSYGYDTPIYLLDVLNNFVLSGGKLIFASWDVYNYSSHALLSNLGISFVSDFTEPQNFYCDYCSHPTFNTPNQVYEFYWTDNQSIRDGQIVNVLSGSTLLAYPEDYWSGHVVLNSTGNCIFNGFQSENFNGDNDYDGKYDIQELIENEIQLLTGGNSGNGETCESSIDFGYVNSSPIYGSLPGSYTEVWYKFHASNEQNVSISLCGSDFDTWLEVYDECGNDALAVSDDYDCLTKKPVEGKDSRSPQSQVDFSHLGSGYYYVKISGFSGNYGNFVLSVHTSDDLCNNASYYGTVGSGTMGGNTSHAFGVNWYYFDVPYNVYDVSVSLCGSDYDTYLAVYDACGGSQLGINDDYDCDAKHPVESKDGRSLQSQLDFSFLAAGTYYAKVYGCCDYYGNYALSVFQNNSLTPPTNLSAYLDDPTGEVFLDWDYESGNSEGFYEDFEDGVADNFVFSDSRFTVSGGDLVMNGYSNDTWASTYYNANYTDFGMEFEVRRTQSEPTLSYSIGAFIRSDGFMGTGFENGYLINVNPSGYYSAWLEINGSETNIIPWTESTLINTGLGSSNYVYIDAYGPNFVIYINGVYVDGFTDYTFSSGYVNLVTYDKMDGWNEVHWGYCGVSPYTESTVFEKPEIVEQSKTLSTGDITQCTGPVLNNPFIQPVSKLNDNMNTNNRSFQNFNIYRDGGYLTSTSDSYYYDYLNSSGYFEYTVTAVYDEGESNPAGPATVYWDGGDPSIFIYPASFEENLDPGETSTQWFTIYNFGEGDLNYNIAISDLKNQQTRNAAIRDSDSQKSELLNTNDNSVPVVPTEVFKNISESRANNVLIFRDNLAWSLDVIVPLLQGFGASASVATSSEMSTIDLSPFSLIIFESQQPNDFYNAYVNNIGRFESYLSSGGVIEFHCATWTDYRIPNLPFPGGMQTLTNDDLDDFNYINNPSHPIVSGAVDPFYGTSASHEAFENLPAGADVIVVNESGLPTTVEYSYGSGTMIVTAMTWEIGYNIGWNFGDLLPNALMYSMGLSGGSFWLSADPLIGTVASYSSVDIQVNFDATDLSVDFYSANINISSNDPYQPLVVVPVTLTVGEPVFQDISVSPASLEEELEPEQTSTQYLTITNGGDGDLNWNILQSQTKITVKEKYSNGDNSFANNALEYSKNGIQTNSPTFEKIIENDGIVVFQKEIDLKYSGAYINFDDLAAPCWFVQTNPLTNEYLSSGITFIGNGNDGGAVVNECSNFGVVGHSSPNFLAFNINSQMGNGGIPQGPQTILFTNLVSYVELYAGHIDAGEIIIEAFDSDDNTIAYSSLPGSNILQPLAVSAQGIKKVVISFTGSVLVIDDLFFSSDYYTGWLSNAPTYGSIPPGSSETIGVTFDATGLTPDVYTANINISSNDPDEPLVVVPVTLTVSENVPLVVDFMAEPLSGTAPLMVEFTDLSDGNVIEWEWDFDNNGSVDSYEQNPVWTYNSAGVYSVKLTVYDNSKGSDFELKTDYITVISEITYFEPVWTSPYNPMTIYVVEALIDNADLQPLSQIGVFDTDPNNGEEICVGAMILNSVISPGNYLEIITSMDDGSIPGHANGFTPGHPFIFKYMTNAGQLVEDVSFSFPYSGYNEVFTSQGSTIVELSDIAVQPQQQTISLNSGWTGISSYLIPQNSNIQNVVAGIEDELLIIQNLDEFYQPGNPTNSLQNWDYQSGYFIKVTDETTLTIFGTIPGNKSISLNTGWNLIPVLSNCEVSIDALFAGQVDKLEFMKDAIGFDVYWPSKTISTLTQLTPGHSYLLKVTENIQVTFPDCE